MNRLSLVSSAILCASMIGGMANWGYTKSLDEEMPTLTEKVCKQLVATDGKKKKIAIMDVLNLQGQQNELGRSLAEQLSVEVVMAGNVSVVDRANIDRIMNENKFARTLANPDDVKKLGKIAGLDAIAIGTVNCSSATGDLIMKVISIETAELIAAGRCKFDMTEDLMKQFSTAINGDAAVASGESNAGNGTASSQESKGIAKKMFDNLEVVLATITPSSIQWNRDEVPAVRCTFEIRNLSLRDSVVIAANATKVEENTLINICSYRGGLCDSNGKRWWMPSGLLKGLPAILCCDASHLEGYEKVRVEQSNPSAVVDYVKRGKQCENGDTRSQDILDSQGKFWTGSFSTIPPGKSIHIVAEFIPNSSEDRQDGGTKLPQSFQLDMELVIGSVINGAAPETAKNLRLENLVFDKIVMPVVAKTSNQ